MKTNGKYPFNRLLTAQALAKMLAGANIKVLSVTVDEFDELDDEIKLEKDIDIQVGRGYVMFNYWEMKDGVPVSMYSKEVKNFMDLLAEIKKRQLQ